MSVAVETRRTFCRVCHVACALDVDVDVAADKVLAVRGVVDDPVFGGYTCSKGRQLPAQLSDPDRLRHPLIRTAAGLPWRVTITRSLWASSTQAFTLFWRSRTVTVFTGYPPSSSPPA